MKRIKQVDWWVQVIMLAIVWIMFIVNPALLLFGYLVLGLWQVLGMVYHEIKGCYTGKSMPRYYFHRCILFFLVVSIILLLFPSGTHPFGVAIIAPVLSICYTIICYKETFRYMIRPLDLI